MIATFLAAAVLQAADPYLLPIGDATPVEVNFGFTDLRTGDLATAKDVAIAADGIRYVLLGESHDNADHHRYQAAVIEALVARGRRVTVGFEMFTRPNQPNLAPYTLGRWSEAEFIQRANWQTEWGFPFELYKPIFDAVREYRLPMVALNVPREWVRTVGRDGLAALPSDTLRQFADLDLSNRDHRSIFGALMGGHPPTGARGESIYSAQVLWDEGMADTAIKATRDWSNPNRVMVIIAGVGHVMYGQGIGYRITRRTGLPTLTVSSLESAEPRLVSRSLGDFVYMSRPVERQATRN